MLARINCWTNTWVASNLRRHGVHSCSNSRRHGVHSCDVTNENAFEKLWKVGHVVLGPVSSRGFLYISFHDAGNGLKDPTTPISTYRRCGHPYPHNRIQWEYNGLRGENRGPFKGQQALASNPVMLSYSKRFPFMQTRTTNKFMQLYSKFPLSKNGVYL